MTCSYPRGSYLRMAKNPIFQMRIAPETKTRWKAAAEAEGISLAVWITAKCESTGIVFVPATPEETAALPIETKKKLLAAVGKLKRAQSEKKVKRAAAAESARASVQVPQRRGEMVDVKMAEPNLVAQCRHHHGYGEVCYKCDPKMGYPSIG